MSLFCAVIRNLLAGVFMLAGVVHYASAEIQPSQSAVLIPSGKEDAIIDIKNTGEESVLLYSKIVKLPDDNLAGGVIFTEPQTILMAPGDTQSIRVRYQTNTPDSREHIARVIFSGLPPNQDVTQGKVRILLGQDLPVVVNVRKDMEQKDIWQRVRYRLNDGGFCMMNPTAKIFRFSPEMYTDEGKIKMTFRKPYLLPAEELCTVPGSKLTKGMHVNITSVSDFNYLIKTNKIQID